MTNQSKQTSVLQENNSLSQKENRFQMPDAFVIICSIAALIALLTWIIPVGSFQNKDISYVADGIEKTRTVIDPSSFKYVVDENGELGYNNISLFSIGDNVGLLNFPFEGLVSGSKYGSAVGIIMFMLVIGGAFGIVMKTGAIDNGILKLIDKTRGNEALFVPIIFILFSLGGAVFGMGEEAIAFAIIIAPLMVKLGYDSIVTVMVTYVATQIGFATSWMNPFGIVIAQGIADVPVLSGSAFRIAMWVAFTAVGIVYTLTYAARIKKSPTRSFSYQSDEFFRRQHCEIMTQENKFSLGDSLVIVTIFAVTSWVIWGVVVHSWYIPEIASQFFTMGIVCGLIAVCFKLNNMTFNDMAVAFKEGAAIMIPPALLVGFAKGMLLLISDGDATHASVLNTILNSTSNAIGGVHDAFAAWCMLVFQAVFNFFVPSGSGQAALTMPLMAPLSDLINVTRQVSVLAFQLGDGLTNIIIPTSASMMGTLGVCRLDWAVWVRFCWRFMTLLFIMASIVVVGAQMMGFS